METQSGHLEGKLREKLGDGFEGKVEAKIAEFGGLLTRSAAVRLLCKEHGIEMERKLSFSEAAGSALPFGFSAKVDRIFPTQKYRNGTDRSVRLHLSDNNGSATLILWNEQVALVEGEISTGDSVECSGAYFRGDELCLGRSGVMKKTAGLISRISGLTAGVCNAEGVVGEIEPDYVYKDRKTGAEKTMSSFQICDVHSASQNASDVERAGVQQFSSGARDVMAQKRHAEGKNCRRVVVWSAPEGTPGVFEGDTLLLENVLFRNGELHFNSQSRMVVKNSSQEFSGKVEEFRLVGKEAHILIGKRKFSLQHAEALKLLGITAVPQGVSAATLLSIKGSYLVGKGATARMDGEKLASLKIRQG